MLRPSTRYFPWINWKSTYKNRELCWLDLEIDFFKQGLNETLHKIGDNIEPSVF